MDTNNTQNFNDALQRRRQAAADASDFRFQIRTELEFAMRQNPLVKVILNKNDDWFDDFNTDTWANRTALDKLPLYYCFLQTMLLNEDKYFDKVLAKTRDVNTADKKGNTTMHHICAWVLLFECMPNRQNDFALLKAKNWACTLLKRLLRAGGDATRSNNSGICPVDLAVVSQNKALIQVFYDAGVFQKVTDKQIGTLHLFYRRGKERDS